MATGGAQVRGGTARTLHLCVAVATGGVMLAGCTADSDAPSTEPTESAYLLQEYLSEISEGIDYVAQTRMEQDFVAACMAEAGFEYIPILVGPIQFTMPEADEWAAFQAVEGWGVTVGQTGIGMEHPGSAKSLTGWVAGTENPNDKIFLELSPGAQEVYSAAHSGDGGCDAQAREAHSIDTLLAATPELLALYEEAYELFRSDGTDVRTIDLNARWAQCMEDSGYLGYTTPSFASSAFESSLPRSSRR